MSTRGWTGAFLALTTVCWAGAGAARERPIGVVIEEVEQGGAAAEAELEAGDLLLSWWTAESGGRSGSQDVLDPFDLALVELEHGSRIGVWLSGFRVGREIAVKVRPGSWGLKVRPQLARATLPTFTAALEDARGGMPEAAEAAARQMAAEAGAQGETHLAAWFLLRVGQELAGARAWDAAAALDAEAARVLDPCPDPAVCALAYHAHAVAVAAQGRADVAETSFETALEHWARSDSGELGAAATEHAHATALFRAGNLDAAAVHFRNSLAVRRRLAPRRLCVAESLLGLAGVHLARAELEPARKALTQALAITLKEVPDSLALASTLDALGELASVRGELDLAEEHLETALALREELAPGSLAVAESVTHLAEVAERREEAAVAEHLYRRATGILEEAAPESLQLAVCLESLGRVVGERGDLADSEYHLGTAVGIWMKAAPASTATADGMGAVGMVAFARGHRTEARGWLTRALAVYREADPGSPAVARVLERLAGVASAEMAPAVAEELLCEALALRAEAEGSGAEQAAVLDALGRVAEAQGDLAAARAWHEQAWTLRAPLADLGIDGLRTAIELGRLSWELGDVEKGEELLAWAVALAEVEAPGSLDRARAVRALAAARVASGDLEGAIELLRAAVSTCEVLVPDSAELAWTLRALARALRTAGETEEALAQAVRAAAVLDRQKATLGGELYQPPATWTRYLPVYEELLDQLMESGRPEEAWHALERSHAWWLASLAAGRELGLDSRVSEKADQRWRIARTAYWRRAARLAESSTVELEGEGQQLRTALDEARRDLDAARAAVAAAAPGVVALLEPEPADLDAAARLIEEGTLALAWAVGEEHTFLFAFGPGKGSFAAHRIEVGSAALGADVSRLVELIAVSGSGAEGRDELGALTDRLGSLLLASVAGAIEGAQHLVLVPDGPLRRLPFPVLTDRGPAGEMRYLVERASLSVTASLSLLGDLGAGRARDESPAILIVVDPSAAAGAEGRPSPAVAAAVARGLRLEPTSATAEEAEAVAALFPDLTSTWVGDEVTEERVAVVGRKPSVIHLGVRAHVDDRLPLESGLLLSLPEAWAEGEDDGLLQAWEVFERTRLDAYLVTLSRCAPVPDEASPGAGLTLLTRALQHAGTRSVLVSLWEEGGPAAVELMRRFYSGLGRGLDKDAALREAQVELLSGPVEVGEGEQMQNLDATHPISWAGYRLVGDFR